MQQNEFSEVTTLSNDDLLATRALESHEAAEVLAKLDEARATGPDTLPTRILKNMDYPSFFLPRAFLQQDIGQSHGSFTG